MIWPVLAWAGLLGAGAAVMAAYFYRRRSRVILVPAVDDWIRVGRPVDTRSISTLLRSLVSLLAQLALVALVALALAECLLAKPRARRLAVVIDAGATMQTRESDGRTRFEIARQRAGAALDRLPEGCEVFLIQAAHRPLVPRPSASNRTVARADLDAAAALDVESDLGAAVRAAAAFVGNDPAAEVLVLSDFSAEPPSAVGTKWTHAAKLTPNPIGADAAGGAAAITNFWCERSPAGCTIGGTVLARGTSGRAATVTVSSNGAIAWTRTVNLADGATPFRAELTIPPLAAFEVAVDAQDALPLDDRAFGVAPPPRRSICLVTRGNAPLERAVRADATAHVRVVAPEHYQPAGDEEVLIVDNVDLPSVPAGAACLFIASRDPLGRVGVREAVDVGAITHWLEHAALADVEPDLIRVRRARRLIAGGAGTVSLVSAADVPLVVATADPAGLDAATGPPASAMPPPTARPAPALFWLFRIDDTDLASRPSFPVLVWDAIDHLSGETNASATRMARTGRPLEVGSADGVAVVDPAGKPLALQPLGAQLVARDVVRHGVYQLTTPVGAVPIAVNLLSDRGTRPLLRNEEEQLTTSDLKPPSVPWWRGGSRWKVLAAAALVLATVEWLMFHRGMLRIA